MAKSLIVILVLFLGNGSVIAGDRFLLKSDAARHLFANTTGSFKDEHGSLNPEMQVSEQKKKSVGLAAIYSLLLPGMGELYAGEFGSGKYFVVAEGALWLTYATFEIYGNSLRDDARAYAISRAGISPVGKDDQFYIDIGNFLDIGTYNEAQLRNRDPEKLYDPNAGFAWHWESDAARASYRDQRISGEQMYNNRKFVVAAILINHVASAINAARTAIFHNKEIDDHIGGLSFKANLLGGILQPHGLMLTVTKVF